MARTNAVLQRISRARWKLGQQLMGGELVTGERMIIDVDGLLLSYRYSDRVREFVLEGELVRVTPELARAVEAYVSKHRP